MALTDIARGGLAQTTVSVSVAGVSSLTLTGAQAINRTIVLTGSPSANCTVTVPCTSADAGLAWIFVNSTGTTFTLSVVSSAGGGSYNIPQGRSTQVLWNGTNMLAVESASVRSDYVIVAGITGVSPTTTLTAAQYSATTITLQGDATGTPVVVLPNGYGLWLFNNQLGVAVNVKTAGGTAASVPSASNHWIFIDSNSNGGNANAV